MFGTSNVAQVLRQVGRAQPSLRSSSSYSYRSHLSKFIHNQHPHRQHQHRPLSSSSSALPFKPPPIRQRLKPLIPFFIYWSLITSLAVHLLRLRIQTQEEMDKRRAQISVLTNLVERIRHGELLGEDDMRREMEMVGLRERSALTLLEGEELGVTADVGWKEVFFGKKIKLNQEEQAEKDAEIIQEWAQVVNQATDTHTPSTPSPSSLAQTPTPDWSTASPVPLREAKRAPSANVYM